MIDDYTRFTEGDCHILAKRIHRLTGWPLMAFSHSGGPASHAFVQHPSKLYLDIEGLHTAEVMRYEWGDMPIIAFALSDFSGEWSGCRFGNYSYRRARIVADQLLEQYGV